MESQMQTASSILVKTASSINAKEASARRRKMTPKHRFRAIVRLVMANAVWLTDLSDVKYGTKLYNLKKSMKSNMSLEHKAILNKAPEFRTTEENMQIYKIIGAFKCFRKYPENVKMMLASYSHFCYFGPDRVIVRENHYATAIFFIISGEVSIIEEKYDSFLNETERIASGTLSSGDVFGEICLLHNMPRMETIISNTPVEFLILKRDDFDIVLKGTVKEEWDYISSVMDTLEYFQDWDKVRIGECCMQSLIKTFKKDDTVLGDGYGRKNYVHFVIKGSCVLIEHLNIEKVNDTLYRLYMKPPSIASTPSATKRLFASIEENLASKTAILEQSDDIMYRRQRIQDSVSLNEFSLKRDRRSSIQPYGSISQSAIVPHNVETVFMQVCTFREKACFSLGEPMMNRRIVATEQLTCLLIPCYMLVGRDNIWLRIKQFLTKRIPTSEIVFECFLRQRRWRNYKSELVKPLLTSYCTNWYCNIPYSLRIRNDFDFKSEMSTIKSKRELLH